LILLSGKSLVLPGIILTFNACLGEPKSWEFEYPGDAFTADAMLDFAI